MTRWANSGNATAAAQQSVGMVTLADLNFASGTVYVHDAYGPLVANGNTYQGLGSYGSMDLVLEDLAGTAKAVTLILSGCENSLISSVMTENYQGRLVTLYVGLLDVNTVAWYANPEVVWSGRMDYPQIDIGQGVSTIRLNCENRLNREPMVSRYTDQDQQLLSAGDNFFNLLWQIPLASCNWGAVNVFHPANIPPGNNKWVSPVGGGSGIPGFIGGR